MNNKELLKIYINENFEKKEKNKFNFHLHGGFESIKNVLFPGEFDEEIDIDEYIEKNKYNTFQTTLFNYIDERNLRDSDVYNKVHMDRKLFSKIRNNKHYHPSKETVILLGLSLELSEKEIINLLDDAGYTLPKNNYFDLIIRFCFINSIYDVIEVNSLLDEYNCKLLK